MGFKEQRNTDGGENCAGDPSRVPTTGHREVSRSRFLEGGFHPLLFLAVSRTEIKRRGPTVKKKKNRRKRQREISEKDRTIGQKEGEKTKTC